MPDRQNDPTDPAGTPDVRSSSSEPEEQSPGSTSPGPKGVGDVEPPDGVTVEIVMVTPALAEEWLTHNTGNRNLRRAVVDSYRRDMAGDAWLLNGESIKFDRTGRMRDGQHRLYGVIESGQTVPMIVVRGLSEDVMPTVDAGTKRTYSDTLRMAGEENTATLAAVTRKAFLWSLDYRVRVGRLNPTATELGEFLDENPSLRSAADLATRLASKAMIPASVLGHAAWLLAQIDTDDAQYFLARVADGDGLASDHPIAAFRSRLVKMRVGGNRVNETETLALLVLAWNAYRAGETRSKLQLPKGGLTNDNFPTPR